MSKKNYNIKSYEIRDKKGKLISRDYKFTPKKDGQFISFETVNNIYKKLAETTDPSNIIVLGMNGINTRTLKRANENVNDLEYNDEDYYAKYNTQKSDKFKKYVNVQFIIKDTKRKI